MKKSKQLRGVWLLVLGMLMLALMMPANAFAAKSKETWSIYVYLCGSDLESKNGAATADLMEMLNARLSDNVTIVIQTGGARKWQNKSVSAQYLERYVYDSRNMRCVDQVKRDSMGKSETLRDFLKFCKKNYPADHEAFIFWNHGGGSIYGAAFDELYGYDALTLKEMHDAFKAVYSLSETNPPLEFVGFDACLMATIDTAGTFSDIAKYMIASEEAEPGCGWDYTTWINALVKKPSMSGAELGKYICDSYIATCQRRNWAAEATLSVVDLSKMGKLLTAYDAVGKEALKAQYENRYFYTDFSRAARCAENYGGNTASSGYYNLVDLGDLMRQNVYNLPKNSKKVLDALNECVVYKVNGPYKSESTGLSCYFSLNNDKSEMRKYQQVAVSGALSDFYQYALTGVATQSYEDLLSSWNYDVEELEDVPMLDEVLEEKEDLNLYISEDGYAVLELSEEVTNTLTSVYFELAYVDEASDLIIWLGTDNDISSDWDSGIFYDNFRGVWGALDGHLCYMDLVYEGEDYNLYQVPIMLNGEDCQLHIVYDYSSEEYYMLGARRGLDGYGMSDRNLMNLYPGDVVTTLVYAAPLSSDEGPELYEWDSFRLTKYSSFDEVELGDGEYTMTFTVQDCRGNELTSRPVLFTLDGNDIYTEILD